MTQGFSKSRWRVALVIGFIQFLAIQKGSADSLWLNSSMLDEKMIYSVTLEACSRIAPENLYGGLAFDQLYAGKFPSTAFSQLIHSIFSEEFKKNTIYLLAAQEQNENATWLLHSKAFNRAAGECFPENKDLLRFKSLVSLRQRAGRSAGIVASAIALSGASSALQKVSTFLYRAWLGAGMAVAGTSAYKNVEETLKEIKNQSDLKRTCGDQPKIDCATEFLLKNSQQD